MTALQQTLCRPGYSAGRLWRTLALGLLAWAALLSPMAQAEVSAEDRQSVQAVVQGQLNAFAADDAAGAFSFAAPNIRDMFGSAENFMAMVQQAYPVVYRPAALVFLMPQEVEAGLLQAVQMRDRSGKSWLAVYTLQRQPAAGWLISSCVLVAVRSVGA